jgi:prepilin-type N-terminal cleavage/methylation domain-containing protein
MKQLPNKQQGFTLLELLVVITLLAVLAVGALVAYDGVGDKAEAAAAANANVNVDNMVRQFKAVTNAYPNQWDNLVALDDTLIDALPEPLKGVVEPMVLGAAASNVTSSLGRAGINELQRWTVHTKANNVDASGNVVLPNLAHNESFNPNNATEGEHFDDGAVADPIQSIAAVKTLAACTANGAAIPDTTDGTNSIQNKYSDFLESDECHLVVALGFGSDAAASTTGASVQIGKAPSFSRTDAANPDNNVNPNEQYSRYIGLFLVASAGEDAAGDPDTVITDDEYLDKARLIALIAPDGTIADQNLAAASKK